jgi:hypothetical protein
MTDDLAQQYQQVSEEVDAARTTRGDRPDLAGAIRAALSTPRPTSEPPDFLADVRALADACDQNPDFLATLSFRDQHAVRRYRAYAAQKETR